MRTCVPGRMCVCVLVIHRQIYRTHGSQIVYTDNPIPEDVYLEAKF